MNECTVTVATVDGALTSKHVRYGCRTLIDFCRNHDSFRIMLDFAQVSIELSTLEIYKMPRDALAAGLPHSARVAIVCASMQKETLLFLEVVSQNIGLNVYLFADKERALKWLTQ